MPLGGNTPSPSGRRRRRKSPSGLSRKAAFGPAWAAYGILTSGRVTDRGTASAGKAEAGVPVKNLKRAGGPARGSLLDRSATP
jgi:hypothetical protein